MDNSVFNNGKSGLENVRRAGASAASFSKLTRLAGLLAICAGNFLTARAVITEEKVPTEYHKAEAPPIAWMIRMGGTVSLDIPNPKVSYEVGRQLPLFQSSLTAHLAITPSAEEGEKLTAFPRYVGNEPSAWISAENLLVFGRRAASVAGKFTFEADELVPLVRETADAYIVDVQRLGRHLPMTVSKKTPGVVLVPVQKADPAAAARKLTGIIRPLESNGVEAVSPAKITAENALEQVTGRGADGDPSSEMAIAKIKEDFIKDLMTELEKVKQQKAIEDARKAAATEAARLAAANAPPEPAPKPEVIIQKVEVPVPVAAPKPEPEPATNDQMAFLAHYVRDNAITLVILAICALLLPILAISLSRMKARTAPHRPSPHPAVSIQPAASAPLATEVFTFSSVGESHDHNPHHTAAAHPAGNTGHGDLSGTLSGHILPQVVQFFCAARESGRMTIRQESGLTEELTFNNGQIIDAKTGSITGKDAARAILQQRDGKFTFHRANTSNERRNIHDDTMALLLDAHTALDEKRRTHHG